SINGTTKLAQFDNQNDGGDFGDWQSNPRPSGVGPQVQDAFPTPLPLGNATLGPNEIEALNVIGYTLASVPEPSAVALLSTGMILASGFGCWHRRQRR